MRNILHRITTYALYPTLLILVLVIILCAIRYHWDYKSTYGLTTLGLVITLMILEYHFPLSPHWKMTAKSFLRDIKYIAIDAPVIAFAKSAFGILAIYYSERHTGLFTDVPPLIGVVGYLLVFEFIQYWYHRLSHRGKGTLGEFLWKVHLAHHLPDRVYVVMHAVFNPINALISAAIIQTPLILLGISPEAILAATLLIDLQSVVSHFNVDVRAGFLNYIFIGTETHRYHHSTNMGEAGNYGNTLSIWDLVFGTFYYNPGTVPEKLGIDGMYPQSNELWKVISYPFRGVHSGKRQPN